MKKDLGVKLYAKLQRKVLGVFRKPVELKIKASSMEDAFKTLLKSIKARPKYIPNNWAGLEDVIRDLIQYNNKGAYDNIKVLVIKTPVEVIYEINKEYKHMNKNYFNWN